MNFEDLQFHEPLFLAWNFAGDPAREVLKDSCQELMLMCRHVRSTFAKAVDDYRTSEKVQAMKIDSKE